jgi:hypothetical protein
MTPRRKPTGFPPDVLAGILIRDGNICAMIGATGCRGHVADEGQHRLNRGSGGSSAPYINSPANGCAIEHGCNWRLEAVAEFAEEGRRRGVKLEQGADPHTIPLWSPFYRQWMTFDIDGSALLTGITDLAFDARDTETWRRLLS